MSRNFLFLAAALFAGCATAPPPPLSSASPASPHAREGVRTARVSSLGPDESTRKSHEMLAAAQKEQQQWDAYGPVSGTPEKAPGATSQPSMNHGHH